MFIDNVSQTLKQDLISNVGRDCKIAIAASCFSIFAFQEMKKQLLDIDELRFIFTSPAFITEKAKKECREFYIPRLEREKSLYGTEFEIKLRNELTQKAIAKECAEWIKRKVKFRSITGNARMGGFLNIENGDDRYAYVPINGFTTVDLGCEKGNDIYSIINRFETPACAEYFRVFDEVWNDHIKLQDVTEQVLDSITTAYKENAPEYIYFVTLYNVFSEFLEDVSEDVLPNEATGFKQSQIWGMLYNFQQDAALAVINKLEKYNGCILADSVGLGKTFTALAVIKYYENRNKSVLVLCPKKLSENWNTYNRNLLNNPIAKDRLNYDVLYHTDLSRTSGYSNAMPLDRVNWGNYDLVVIDESHNFRNGGDVFDETRKQENRYVKLMNKVIRSGVKTKVLMLSATPVNNRFSDLKNQLALAYEGKSENISDKLDISRSLEDVFNRAQRAFNAWSKFRPEERTTEQLLSMLDFEFFEVLDSVTIARSRKHIQNYYDTTEIGTFPERNKPLSLRCQLTALEDVPTFNEIFEQLSQLNLGIYTPSQYILASKKDEYELRYATDLGRSTFKQIDREFSLLLLMRTNLLKRLESSVHSFRLTIERMLNLINDTIGTIERFDGSQQVSFDEWTDADDFDIDDENDDAFTFGKKVQIELQDMDYASWKNDLEWDRGLLTTLLNAVEPVTPQHDQKLNVLLDTIRHKIRNPINSGNKKVLVFSAFTDTVEYLYQHVSTAVKAEFGLESAMITGGVDGRSTIQKLKADFNTVLSCFSPISKERHLIRPDDTTQIDILIATDCISEGQNLQDCDYLINYDIHWNPVRIIQRFGRIDRIGSKNKVIQLVNFWPDISLDDYINLKARVESRMKITVMTATGDGNPIDELQGDIEYRKRQLERLQTEVVDIEEMSGGISIMDLGLNEFRMDLISYIKENPDLEKVPRGMNAVVGAAKGAPAGVIYVLRNINDGVNINHTNRLHPFYIVYITDAGEVYSNHLKPKETLDLLRLLCKGKREPDSALCRRFNEETKDGKAMGAYSKLLEQAISSIIDVGTQSDIDSLFKPGGTSALLTRISGLNDFELISFVVIK